MKVSLDSLDEESRKGGRVKAFSHIAPVNEQLGEMVTGKIESKLRG